MIFDILLIIAGVAMVLYGADRLTEGASALARSMNVPEIIIGLTIVAAGTSAPELFVSMVSALKGTPDMAIGNVVGSNTMNAMLIVGCAAMVAPMTISKSTVRKDIPFSVFASVLLVLLSLNSFLGRLDGIFLLAGFALFMYYTLSQAKVGETASVSEVKSVKPWLSAFFVLLGLALLVIGSNIFVDSASRVAYSLGISEGVVGLTIVAGGTSLPELATSVVAARKGQSAIAIGNVIGSNVFNILLILGLTATISPMQIQGVTLVDMGMMLGSVSLVWLFSYTRYTVERWEGALLVIGYLVYLGWLLSNV
ncbi:calcium/sodium antiporter [Prevotella sp. tf2-5]|uniref:calcium/sodium antiporter n=1 Tax=Prevotella sp. tf2-5 TaxID=1761889 RepID=UPI0008F1EDDA|nr:calcium/sodium antiporter [Prevotella sp. tf2-5]SFO81911.1 cation:H+ antiporter [Prevotella sp. tf2-5]